MATMNAEMTKRVKALKINAKNEDEARKSLLKILNENGIEGMEEEDTDTLIEIAESFVEDSSEDVETIETDEDALANEAAEEELEDESEEDESNDSKEDEFDKMDRTELKTYIKDNNLGIKVKKSWSDDEIRFQIRNVESPTTTDKQKEIESVEKEQSSIQEVKEKTVEKSKTDKKTSKRGTKIDPKNNEEDRKIFDCLHELFPEDEYVYAWVSSAGVTIKHKGKNSQRAIALIENCSIQNDSSVKCNLYLTTFNKQTDILDEAGIEYEICWSGAPFVKGITLDEAVDMLESLMPNITETVRKIDKRLGDNRAKMEESLENTTSPKKKPIKK